jgi:hypothetical protein
MQGTGSPVVAGTLVVQEKLGWKGAVPRMEEFEGMLNVLQCRSG